MAAQACPTPSGPIQSLRRSPPRALSGKHVNLHQRSSKHFKNHSGRPTEQQHAIHRSNRSKQPPALNRGYVTITERRVVYEREICEVGCRRGGIQNPLSKRPNKYL